MKKLILATILYTAIASILHSQHYHSIEWDILGISKYQMTSSELSKRATGLHTEIRVNLDDRFSIGLKYDVQFFKSIFAEPIIDMGTGQSYTLTGDYYMYNKVNKRVFAGIEVGSFQNKSNTESGEEVGGRGFGIVPRIGYELGYYLRVTAAYDHTFKENYPNFLALGIGLNIGGRYRGFETGEN